MPERRVQYDPGLRPQVIRPIASPVDEFVRPAPVDKLDQLGAALSRISPEIQQFAGTVADNVDSSALNEGRLAAEKLRTEGLTLAEATRKGVIQPSQNPFYMKGLYEQQGRNLADKYDSDLRAAVGGDTQTLQRLGLSDLAGAAENLVYSTNLNDLDEFTKKFREGWSKQNIAQDDTQNSHFNTGFQFKAGAYESQVRTSFANGIDEKVKVQGDEATHQDVVGAIHNALTTGTPLDAEKMGLNQHLQDLMNQGRNPAQVLRTTALAIANAAAADPLHSKEILGLMDSVKGKGGPLSSTSYGMALARKAEGEASESLQRSYTLQREKAAADKSAAETSVFQSVNDALDKAGDNAHNVDMKPFKEQMNKVAPDKVETIDNMQNAWVSHDIKEDPNVADHLFVNMYTAKQGSPDYVSEGTVAAALGAKQISVATFKSLMAELHERDKPEKQVTNDRFFTMLPGIIHSDIVNNVGDSQENQIRANSMSLEAQAEFIRRFSGKTGAEFDTAKNEFIQTIRGQILDPQGTPKERQDYLRTPQLNTGPKTANYKTVPLVPRQTLNQLRSQQDEISQGKRARFDAPLMRVLQANGIKPDNQSVIDFIVYQQALFDRGKTYTVNP